MWQLRDVGRSARVAVVVAAACAAVPALAQPVTFAGETQINGVGTSVGFFDVNLPAFGSGVGYANVSIDINHDNFITPNEWIVQNSAQGLNSTDFGSINGINMSFPFNASGLGLGGSYNLYTSYSSFPTPLPTTGGSSLTANVPWGTYNIGGLINGVGGGIDGRGGSRPSLRGGTLGPQVPPLGGGPDGTLVGRVRHDIPGILQGTMECGPTSAAQSLLWMKARGQAIGTLPATANMVSQLKTDMAPAWNGVNPYPGINPNNFVPGKFKFVVDNNLSISTVSGGAFNGTGTFDFVKASIEAGKDVEMRIQYPNNGGGHWVTIAGWYDDGVTKKLYFKDPLTGGTKVEEYTISGTAIQNYKYGAGATMSFAVAESVPGPGSFACLGMAGIFALRRRRR